MDEKRIGSTDSKGTGQAAGDKGSRKGRLASLLPANIPPWAVWAVAAILVVAILTAMVWRSSSSNNQQLDLATKSFEAGDYDKATKSLDSLLAKNPNDVQAILQMARVKAATGDSQAALKHYARVIKAQPGNGPVLYEMALLERLIGRSNVAAPHFAAAYESDKGNARYFDDLIKTYVQVGKAPKAAEMLRAAAGDSGKSRSERKDLFVRLALVSLEMHDDKGARAALKSASDLVAGDPQVALLLKRIGK